MISYLVTAPHDYTVRPFLERSPAVASRFEVIPYESLSARSGLPGGVCVFSDLDRLSPAQMEAASRLAEDLERAPEMRVLNTPDRTMLRYELLEALWERGTNRFRAYRLSERPRPRFPVFLRHASDHDGALTPLLGSKRDLAEAVLRLLVRGRTLHDLLVVEFCDTSGPDGLFCKYGAYVVGDRIVPQHRFVSRTWMLKGDDKILSDETLRAAIEYQETNPHEAQLSDLCSAAGVGYGRVDYSLLGEDLQIWEINTNPTLVPSGDLDAVTSDLVARFTRMFSEALLAVDRDDHRGREVPIQVDGSTGAATGRPLQPGIPRSSGLAARVPPRAARVGLRVVAALLWRPLLWLLGRRLARIEGRERDRVRRTTY